MSLTIAVAALSLLQAPASADQSVDVAFDELSAARNSEAIVRIESNAALDRDDPARLINLAVAYAREGRTDEARELLDLAVHSGARYQLETASGDWVDSRRLALKAIAMLDSGQLGSAARVASR
ncbi:hypothetical protein GRI43_00875 [Altererythrobacter luteolus]|uniref:Tetratricopeptide repeat-containing protein n=1 Tax=Pontixanthobacter luteolus TaxID=295089 RepID=A0A6I4UWK4_9SPHN|nr:hypothetical protein [Pontixanthobacter luteolus]MXP45945.1 hypothetical protein [Pontixanthobacter luteolus]